LLTKYLGEFLSLLSPLLWAFAVILFRKGGQSVDPISLNLFKNWVGFSLLLCTMLLIGGTAWSETSARDIALLTISGIIGISIADTLYFYALNIVGASRMAVIGCFYMPTAVILSFIFLGDSFNLTKYLGSAAVFIAITIIALQVPTDQTEPHTSPVVRSKSRIYFLGLMIGIFSVLLMAIGIVITKPVLDRLPILWTATIRLGAGLFALQGMVLLHPRRREIHRTFAPSPVWWTILPAAIFGTYLSYVLWIGGMKYANVSVAAVLNQVNVVFITVLAIIFLREKVTIYSLFAIILATCGSIATALK
jgi:drug/metabolite transporter (DMT)-like permease